MGKKKKFVPDPAMRVDVYDRVTNRIVEMLETHGKWDMPFAGVFPRNMLSGKEYQGINTLMLWCSGFQSPVWGTFKQWRDVGAGVKAGAKGTHVIYWNKIQGKKPDPATGECKEYLLAKSYVVFNSEQVDGGEKYVEWQGCPPTYQTTIGGIAADVGAEVRWGCTGAYYDRTNDVIGMPAIGAFRDELAAENTLAHELIHWSGAEGRCPRTKGKRFGDDDYAKEELVAEIGAQFLCVRAGVQFEPSEQSAAYIGSWLTKLKSDKRWIVSAAAQAQKACNYLLPAANPFGDEETEQTPQPEAVAA